MNPGTTATEPAPAMTATAPKPIRLFSSDLDGTLLGNPEATQRFKAAWERLPPRRRPLLVYNSGRLVDDLRRFVADGTLPAPDYLIGGVGTQIFNFRTEQFLEDFYQFLAEGWDLPQIEAVVGAFPGARRQPPEFQHRFKSSWFLERAAPAQLVELRQRLAAAGLGVSIVYSSQRDLDLLPPRATKAGALQWLCTKLRIGLDETLVAGNGIEAAAQILDVPPDRRARDAQSLGDFCAGHAIGIRAQCGQNFCVRGHFFVVLVVVLVFAIKSPRRRTTTTRI